MPYKDIEARRKAHRKSDKKNRARVLSYRKNQRLQARFSRVGGELSYLVAQQKKDDTRRINGFMQWWDFYEVERVVGTGVWREVHRSRQTSERVWR